MIKKRISLFCMVLIIFFYYCIPAKATLANNDTAIYSGTIKITRYNENQFSTAFMKKHQQELDESAYPEALRTDIQNRINNAVQSHKSIINANAGFSIIIKKNIDYKNIISGDYIVNLGNGTFNGLNFQCLPGGNEEPGYWAQYQDNRYGKTIVKVSDSSIQLKNSTTNEYGNVTYILDGRIEKGKLSGTWSQIWDGVEVFGGEFECAAPTSGLTKSESSVEKSGGFSTGSILIAIVALALLVSGIFAIKKFGGKTSDKTNEQEEKEDDREEIELNLTYPVGRSPKVFTSGWLFGANSTVKTIEGEILNISDRVEWSGSGVFEPSKGEFCRPHFDAPGINTIVLSVSFNGHTKKKQYNINAVPPDGYAHTGVFSSCPSCSHGCLSCPHVTQGPITTGSSHVLINGKPAARVGDIGTTTGCCGSNTFEITEGDPEVLIDGRPAARIGDRTEHCGGIGTIVHPTI